MIIKRFASTSSPSKILKRPIFDYKYVIENAEKFMSSIKRRELPAIVMDNYHAIQPLYQRFVAGDKVIRDLKNQRKILEQGLKTKKDFSVLKDLKKIKGELKQIESNLAQVEEELFTKTESLPNLIHEDVKNGEEVLEEINGGTVTVSMKEDPVYSHKEIGEKLGLFDFKKASQVSGTSWYYLLGDGALLEQALVQYALKLARARGFQMCAPPSIVRTEVTESCGFKPRDQNNEQQVYELKNDGLCMTGTAEIPIAGMYLNHVFESLEELPKRLVGVSRSYRAEAGARGKDTKGLYRVHEFTKVELFIFAPSEESASTKELAKLVDFQKKFIKSLGLTAKVLNMPANDLGAPAYQKFDIEAYMPGRGKYGELTSSSNCLDYQSRRLNIRHKTREGGRLKYVHTLNGTAVAVPRCIVAIIENFYDPETESVLIPEPLRPYMDGKERIYKQ